jgi:hypothetical protein
MMAARINLSLISPFPFSRTRKIPILEKNPLLNRSVRRRFIGRCDDEINAALRQIAPKLF